MLSDTALFTVRAYNTSLMRMSKKTEAKIYANGDWSIFLDYFWPTILTYSST